MFGSIVTHDGFDSVYGCWSLAGVVLFSSTDGSDV